MSAQEPDGGGAGKRRVVGDREREIYAGAIEVLLEVGYDRLTFDAVAAHVRASKATLYRKWPTKADLVVQAVEEMACPLRDSDELPDMGNLRSDLECHFCEGAENDQMPAVIAAVLPAFHRDPELTCAFNTHFIEPRRDALHTLLVRAQERGEIGSDADLVLLSQVLPAMKFAHVMDHQEPPNREFILAVLDDILMPACRATLEPATVL
ncbi:TetR/AcrR family transcriptional regulator [Leekyejoonella antrihumi]|uniref:TetR/AcrR family transcriptional regulator n=1 Tax=Leekyejoonella antrihumi TaxID=1660198 RepID=A0A563E1G6_9MICO|nr:TetR/AcrR family transcriptional regulator [Leekyejoonella antrihumi]TWP35744.1 TetR/AcrR family transcriptional regulator [Leekyejoonella antrihumi]